MDLEFRGVIIANNMHFRVIHVYMEFEATELTRTPTDECRPRSIQGLSLGVLQNLVY